MVWFVLLHLQLAAPSWVARELILQWPALVIDKCHQFSPGFGRVQGGGGARQLWRAGNGCGDLPDALFAA